jgi:cell division protein FtsB
MRKKNNNKLSSAVVSVLSLGIIVIFFSVYLYQSFQIDLIMKDLHKLHEQKNQLISETESLQAEIERLSNIDVISKLAREKYGLEFGGGEVSVIKIEDSDDLKTIQKQFAQEDKQIEKIKTAGIQ